MSIQNPSFSSLTASRWQGASDKVVEAVQDASRRTGVSFDYLMDKARQESSYDPKAKANTSSATGLYQFIESTWLQAVKEYGDAFGLGNLANKINDKGQVADASTRKEILKLREDPAIAATMAAAMTKDNADYLQHSLGGPVGETDLYLAHFLGRGGANSFLKARQQNGTQMAADLFPAAAKANRNVFFEASGKKRSLDQVYDFFANKMNATKEPVLTASLSLQGAKVADISAEGAAFMANRRAYMQKSQNTLPTQAVAPNNPTDISQFTNPLAYAQRRALEAILGGVDAFGNDNASKTASLGKHILSPYTAIILAQLQGQDKNTDSKQS